ncbi:hypothetical protein ABGA94_22240, partial [Stenotrophomonas sp. 3diitr2024]
QARTLDYSPAFQMGSPPAFALAQRLAALAPAPLNHVFFTTSEHGTGLGLYIARELCRANQARLDYIPVPAGGGRAPVLPPAAGSEAAGAGGHAHEPELPVADQRGAA